MDTTTPPIPRWRMITFWVLMGLLVLLTVGDRPEVLGYPLTAFAGGLDGHDVHFFAQGILTWAIIAAILVNLRDAPRQIGAAWVYGIVSVCTFALLLALADLPAEVVPVVAAAVVVGVIAFLAHPSALRERFRAVQRPSRPLLALLAVAVVPLMVYGVGQLDVHAASGPHDEHYEFGHWIVMAIYAFSVVVIGVVAALKVSGWRVPAWSAGTMAVLLGVASLGMTAASQLSTPWALGAIAWGLAFVGVAGWEDRQPAPAPAERRARVPA